MSYIRVKIPREQVNNFNLKAQPSSSSINGKLLFHVIIGIFTIKLKYNFTILILYIELGQTYTPFVREAAKKINDQAIRGPPPLLMAC